MVIDTFVEVDVTSNQNYYKSLGYIIPTYKDKQYRIMVKKGTKIMVNVFDLPRYSEIELETICDCCGEHYKKMWSNHNRDLELNKEKEYIDICCKCSRKLSGEKRKLDIEYVRIYFESQGCFLLSDNYNNNTQILDYICKCGNKYSKPFSTFQQNYMCDKCANESRIKKLTKYSEDDIREYLKNNNCTLLSKWVNISVPIEFICTCGNIGKTTFSHFMDGERCHKCAVIKRSGENNCNWNGGNSKIIAYFKNKSLRQWKIDSMKNCNYKCIVNNTRFNDIHHLYGFNLILKETLNELNFELKPNIGDYPLNELRLLENKLLENHYKYPLGVCLSRDVHRYFHNLYGYGNNTPEQWYEFLEIIKFDLPSVVGVGG